MQNPHTRNSSPAELERLRSRIDEIDAGLIDLIATRLEVAREAFALKEAAGLPREDLAREAAEVRQASALARTRGVEPEVARDVFWRLIGLSRWATTQRGDGPRVPVGEGAEDPR
ncbi:MAG: chorismate mutase [Longimicrobiales bacterium]